mmetsp:Transcript_27047/g.50666  ORF Transcript_27047/g.50666 Transcript_27047/m.50666 type:complete len:220 (-) Transcript_27047:1624-2283(-)
MDWLLGFHTVLLLLSASSCVRRRTDRLSSGPFAIMAKGAIWSNLFASSVHFSFAPFTNIPAAIVPCHFTLTMKVSFTEFTFVFGSINKDALPSSMTHTIHPRTTINGSILISHLSLDHLTSDIFTLKNSTISKSHDTSSMLVIVLETSFIKVSVSIGESAIACPSSMDPITFIPSSFLFVFQAALTIRHARGFAQGSGVNTLFSIWIHNLLVRDKEGIG